MVALIDRRRQLVESGEGNDRMKTHEFIKALRNSADKELIFATPTGRQSTPVTI
jgi:hypothetical protein